MLHCLCELNSSLAAGKEGNTSASLPALAEADKQASDAPEAKAAVTAEPSTVTSASAEQPATPAQQPAPGSASRQASPALSVSLGPDQPLQLQIHLPDGQKLR